MRFGPAWQHRPGKRMEPNGGGGDECLARVPYASVIAALMCGIGVVLFSLMMAWAFNASMQILFVVVAVLMAIAALILLVIGALSTGSTRKELYRFSSVFFFIFIFGLIFVPLF
ncbi:unnamed protein product [Gongylonema pulchrum]|uniref:Transmembrane protein 218 n=1 Tax=Gongylonema pulchrum TaxID=637853 RepID=A0A183E1C6_9BILA|nr:unnamed protein product [Gongylonema pulchrum]